MWLTRAVFLLYAELRKQRLQECQRPCENRLLVMVAVEEKVVDLCVNGRAGVFQIIRKKIVSRNVQGVGDSNYQFKTGETPSILDVTDMLVWRSLQRKVMREGGKLWAWIIAVQGFPSI